MQSLRRVGVALVGVLGARLVSAHSAPDWKPCPEVACADSSTSLASALEGDAPTRPRLLRRPAAAAAGARASAQPDARDCPLDRAALGRATWAFIHTTAAYYPEEPNEEERAAALGLVACLRHLYPCTHCRAQLGVDLDALPPDVSSRAAFAMWACAQHNMVNELLGKPTFPCNAAALDERWRTGSARCRGQAASATSAEESLGQDSLDESA